MTAPIDTHVHLDMMPDPDQAVFRARDNGLDAIVAVGMDLESNRRTLELAAKHPDMVRPALGAHPWNIRETDWLDNLAFLKKELPRAVALGEVGLDYKVKVDKKLQQKVLGELLDLAAGLNKPVLLHSRFSQKRCLQMLRDARIAKAVFHWYSGPLDMLDQILNAGYHVSATPALAYSPPHQAALRHAPLDRILVETDAPEEYQGKLSEPSDVLTTIALLADLKNQPRRDILIATTQNALKFFGPDILKIAT
jgi:TatD DNase family protein